MIQFDDPRWAGLHGGYRTPYDPRPALLSLQQGRSVEAAWKEFSEMMGYRAPPEYLQCYSDTLISAVVVGAKQGIEGIGLETAGANQSSPIRALLNDAWIAFWRNPSAYQAWETMRISEIRVSNPG